VDGQKERRVNGEEGKGRLEGRGTLHKEFKRPYSARPRKCRASRTKVARPKGSVKKEPGVTGATVCNLGRESLLKQEGGTLKRGPLNQRPPAFPKGVMWGTVGLPPNGEGGRPCEVGAGVEERMLETQTRKLPGKKKGGG